MARPNLIGNAEIKSNAFSLGKISLLHSAKIGCLVYGGEVEIPKVIPHSGIRLVPVPDSEMQNERSPHFSIDVLEIKNGEKVWTSGAGVGWWRDKNKKGEDCTPHIDVGLNIGITRDTVYATFWPADDDLQPEAGQEPDGYELEHGPINWRLSYTPPRKQYSRPQAQSSAPALMDEIPY